MTNVYTLKNINNKDNDSFKGVGQRLGGTYEQEFKEKLYSAIKSKAEINDLSEKL
ncbi:16980_t:CDS:1, partial [Rhizophagus irregularis]